MGNLSRVIGCLVLLMSLVNPSSATTHAVDWSLGSDYTSLTTGKAFAVGDTLLFKYGAGHTVDEVNESDYKSCTVGNSISSDSTGSTSISLKTPGTHFFICAVPGHCSSGMKLSVTVSSAGANPTTDTGRLGSSAPVAASPSLAAWFAALYVLVISQF
ncbi:PREDICTED: blue copper protein-like [Tarenaya hassleriana]|uniref:blue copper protein-like n=1 Tax=Tarenaya hassleriana TaxID=28532 RepID=UPI00053C4EF9|nr:PREDICTED: blue copper protein-like [Tarenaya hassleriana]